MNRESVFVVVPQSVCGRKDLTPIDKLVLSRIMSFDVYDESATDCALFLGVARDTVVKAKTKLETNGFIDSVENHGHGKAYTVASNWGVAEIPKPTPKPKGNQVIIRPSPTRTNVKSEWTQWKKRYAKLVPALDEATNYLTRRKIPITDPKALRRSLLAVAKLYQDPDDPSVFTYLVKTYIEYLESDEYLYQLEHTKYCPSILTQSDLFGKFQAIRDFRHDDRRHYDPTKTLTR